MRIIGFNLKKVNAERRKDITGKINISTNLDVKTIEKENIEIAGDVLKISYVFSIKYSPDVAELIFEGSILLVPDDIKKMLKDWKKKIIAEEIKLFVFNFIISKSNLKALQLEEELGLPPHIPLPRLSKSSPQSQQPNANYTG